MHSQHYKAKKPITENSLVQIVAVILVGGFLIVSLRYGFDRTYENRCQEWNNCDQQALDNINE